MRSEFDIIPVDHIFQTHADHIRRAHGLDFKDGAAFIIDKFFPIHEAAVPITDNRADAVYDVVTVSRGTFFRLKHHQDRLQRSCDRLRLTNPFSQEEEEAILHKTVALTGLKDAFVWWSVTRGSNLKPPSDRLNPENFTNRFYAFVIPYIFINSDEQRQNGINIWISKDYIRIHPRSVDPR